jgi:hypothetical protein
MNNKRLETFGGELNSPILPANNFKEHIYNVIDFLRDMGETYSTTDKDERGSIHVHINVTKDIRHKHLIRLLEVGLATEALFYRLGGMGKVNRGIRNNFIYQRPITMPPCVSYRGDIYPIFDYRDLLKTTGKAEFYLKYGDSINCIDAGNHYVTQRYVGLNFYSIPYRGSLEFRYANKVLTPEWLIAWISLCQAFVEYALSKPKDITWEDNYRKLEDNRDIPEDEFLFILDKLNPPEDNKITLLDVWRESTTPMFDGIHRLTHLPDATFYRNPDKYLPKSITEDKVQRSDIVDGRKLGAERQNKLDHIRYDNIHLDLDYEIDDTGVKQKVKPLYNMEYANAGFEFLQVNNINNNPLRNRAHVWENETINHFLKDGLDVVHADMDDKVIWINSRIKKLLSIPFGIFSLNWWYVLKTGYQGLQVQIKFEEDYKTFTIVYRKTVDHRQSNSEEYKYRSNFLEWYDSFGYNVWDLIEECVNNQREFGFDREDELEFIGEDEPEEDNNDWLDEVVDDNPEEEENN